MTRLLVLGQSVVGCGGSNATARVGLVSDGVTGGWRDCCGCGCEHCGRAVMSCSSETKTSTTRWTGNEDPVIVGAVCRVE